MVSTCPLISKSSSRFTNTLEVVPSAPITIGITVTFMFHYDYLLLWWFFTPASADKFLLEIEWQQVSRTLLNILAILIIAVIWVVSTRPPTSKSSRPFNNPFVIMPKAPITIGTIVTFMFHNLFQFSSKFEVLILLFTFRG